MHTDLVNRLENWSDKFLIRLCPLSFARSKNSVIPRKDYSKELRKTVPKRVSVTHVFLIRIRHKTPDGLCHVILLVPGKQSQRNYFTESVKYTGLRGLKL